MEPKRPFVDCFDSTCPLMGRNRLEAIVKTKAISMPHSSFDRRCLLGLLAGTSVWFSINQAGAQPSPAKDDSLPEPGMGEGNLQLQAIGALGVGQIQSTLGLIGVLADSVTKQVYNPKQIEDLMNGTISSLDTPKRILRRMQDTNISGEDAEFLDRMIGVLNALQQEARALAVYAKSRTPDDAAKYERERRRALKKLGELTNQEELIHPEPPSQTATPQKLDSTPKSERIPRTGKLNGANQ